MEGSYPLYNTKHIYNETNGNNKMKNIIISGASDDLIEIEGDIREEFNCYDEEHPQYLAFSEGTVLSIFYSTRGIWEIRRVVIGDAKYSKKEAVDNSIDDEYSDIVTLESDNIQWVVFGSGIAYSNPKN